MGLLFGFYPILIISFMVLIYWIIVLLFSIHMIKDKNVTYKNRVFWILLVLISGVIGLIIYIAVDEKNIF